MRIPLIRLRRTLTIRSLMVVVALVAVGIAGWKAKRHWSECRFKAAETIQIGALAKEFAISSRNDAAGIDADLKQFDPGNPLAVLLETAQLSDDPSSGDIKNIVPVIKDFARDERRVATVAEAFAVKCDRVGLRLGAAAWRPWTDLRPLRREAEEILAGFQSLIQAGPGETKLVEALSKLEPAKHPVLKDAEVMPAAVSAESNQPAPR